MSGADERESWAEGRQHLLADPAFGPFVLDIGPVPPLPRRGSHFEVLCRTIVFQQLAGAAARTIHGRFVEAAGGEVTPVRVLELRDADIRGAGVSKAKTVAIKGLAGSVAAGELDLEGLDAMADSEVVERLTRVRGIGRWTGEMFLLFQMGRPDVWPVTDLGVRRGWARIHGLAEPPDSAELEGLGERHRPWRSVAAWYCYRAVDKRG